MAIIHRSITTVEDAKWLKSQLEKLGVQTGDKLEFPADLKLKSAQKGYFRGAWQAAKNLLSHEHPES